MPNAPTMKRSAALRAGVLSETVPAPGLRRAEAASAAQAGRRPALRCLILGLLCFAFPSAPTALTAAGLILPIEFRQHEIPVNLTSPRGVPISSVTNVPPGSDGQQPLPADNQSGTSLPATTNQFQSFLSFGAITAPTNSVGVSNSAMLRAGTNAFNRIVASAMQLPVGLSNGTISVILRRAQVGTPYLSRQINYLFGSIIAVPETDESGLLLTNVAPAAYWLPEPHSTNEHANAAYYWSPHAEKVYAIQPGPISITWRKSTSVPSIPPGGSTNDYFLSGGGYFRLYTATYVVSGSAVKTPRKMYWTEKTFQSLGKVVSVPPARVGAVNIVYNNNFPRTVPEEYVGPGQSDPTEGTTNQPLPELRTLWFDQQQGSIHAYNQEGRVFVELLGDANPDGNTRQPLGFEIVDVFKQVNPIDLTSELGDRLLPPPPASITNLHPDPVLQSAGTVFAYHHSLAGSDVLELYGTRETRNLNDYMVHWLETGEASLRWPSLFVRYRLVWPDAVERYSHFVRPQVATEAEARATAVPLPTDNVPVIDYQDPLDRPRAKLTEDFKFYTFLEAEQPVHRALLRFSAGENVAFERVLSWLDVNLKTVDFSGTLATNLSAWNPLNQTFSWPNDLVAPRVVQQVVYVGQRIHAPLGEAGALFGEDYLAGHIRQEAGTLFNVNAYVDPFVEGFETANAGAIIPVNAIPGSNMLEVWWFRSNGADGTQGFRPIRWPSVIGRYTIAWPLFSREIVLASNDGSGPLTTFETQGQLYIQNDPAAPGYNPNEEHALLQGGQVFALRDDLNDTNQATYSSVPYVMLEYVAADERPAMTLFRVLREKPLAGLTFRYPVAAGAVLQPPMPLPLLDKPLLPKLVGEPHLSLNHEVLSWTVAGSSASNRAFIVTNREVTIIETNFPVTRTYSTNTTYTTNFSQQSSLQLAERFYFDDFRPLALQNPTNLQTVWLYATNQDKSARTLQGVVSDRPPAVLQRWTNAQPGGLVYRFALTNLAGLANSTTVLLVDPAQRATWFAFVKATNNGYVDLQFFTFTETIRTTTIINGTTTNITPTIPNLAPLPLGIANATLLVTVKQGLAALPFQNWRLGTEALPAGILDVSLRQHFAAFTFQDRKGNLWVYRGPHAGTDQPEMTMRYYYKTLPGFYFPHLAPEQQPPVGTITPYLRFRNADGSYDGDPVHGDGNGDRVGDDNALGIRYTPVWPASAPVLQMAETLTLPKRGLPAMRGQSSLQVLYQQSQLQGAGDLSQRSAVLHDPTREKELALALPSDPLVLDALPDSIRTQVYQGKTYFPGLPPHLSERVFFDPNRGARGKLVFRGQFVDEALGEKYVLLNVLSAPDLEYLKDLCITEDPRKAKWDRAVTNGLFTSLEKFVENPQRPGTFVPGIAFDEGPSDLCEITDDDVAVDSYALTAIGPGTGYVTLVAGNGLAFTPVDDPVSLHVIRVARELFRGEVKILAPSNPLSEKLTLQQVVDLAGQTDGYEFEWKIASPVEGLPPAVYSTTRRLLLGNGTWNHLRFPLATDGPATVGTVPAERVSPDVTDAIIAVSLIPFSAVFTNDGALAFTPANGSHTLTAGNAVTVRDDRNNEFAGTVSAGTTPGSIEVTLAAGPGALTNVSRVTQLFERVLTNQAQSLVYRDFTTPAGADYTEVWLTLGLEAFLGARVFVDGQPVVTRGFGASDTPTASPPADLAATFPTYRLDPQHLQAAAVNPDGTRTHRVVVEFFSQALPGAVQDFALRLDAYEAVDLTAVPGSQWLPLDPVRYRDGVRAILGGTADVRSLSDNYLIMRYRAIHPNHASRGVWSQWTSPQLTEGWIKRVLAGINPFNQRTSDLFNNRVNTDASIVSQAGRRWEGDVALNLETINHFGLIEIYETILRRGRLLSIDAGINYGPANDALLLAAGYLNDLYMMLGNEAWADAANPTIGIGTQDQTYGDIATALFSFRGQVPSLLEEELALLRGRDDFLLPGVQTAPVYNRLVWNYTRGIDAGEVIYALNYNVQENPDQDPDGVINAADAARMFPQAHGDAYGHYLTALKGYYQLLLNPDFDWVPRIEAVTVLGQPVSVDYQDERKFAAAASAVARAGRSCFDLTWRKDYEPGPAGGWAKFGEKRGNTQRAVPTTRYWGVDHWAARTGQGSYLSWVIGNAILPDVDPNPAHEGIQKVDRTTVPELSELASSGESLQTAMDNAEGGLTPLGLPDGSISFDINPNSVVGPEDGTHFEQVYRRAKVALNNAVAAFDDAKDVTRLMRSEQDSLAEFQAGVAKQELAYNNTLIELYGTPYPDDVGPGKTYSQGYAGPDLFHFAYVDMPELEFPGLLSPTQPSEFRIDTQDFTASYETGDKNRFEFVVRALNRNPEYRENTHYIRFTVDAQGLFQRPATWTGQRAGPGKLQEAISQILLARNALLEALKDNEARKRRLDRHLEYFQARYNTNATLHQWDVEKAATLTAIESILFAAKLGKLAHDTWNGGLENAARTALEAIPKSTIVGAAVGGDTLSAARASIGASYALARAQSDGLNFAKEFISGAAQVAKEGFLRQYEAEVIGPAGRTLEDKRMVLELDDLLSELQASLFTINQRLQEMDSARRAYASALAQGDRLQEERHVFRQRAAAVVQGFRTRDAAFRLFRNEKLERYKTLFDLAARYSFLAANAYDYETGLLHTDAGRAFVNRIASARALGVVRNGEPQYAGSNSGDPGLSSALAEMKADWDVLRGRLGFNNPDAYGTTLSLRTEQFRILPGAAGSNHWRQVLQQARTTDLLADADVRRYCMQIRNGDGTPVPGLVLSFSTTILDGQNVFGNSLAAGDHAFSPSAFATKIFGVGVALEGYRGMDNPSANGVTNSPADPNVWFLDPLALSATPYVYLIPVGVDVMRTPPLGDATTLRTWRVQDVAIPLPFNLGASDFSDNPHYLASDSLTEPPFAIRKHQAFRPVASTSFFNLNLYTANGTLQRSQYTNNRLVGRSVWNSQWKLVIPARTLLSDTTEGLERFLQTVTDIKLHFVTYSYSGN